MIRPRHMIIPGITIGILLIILNAFILLSAGRVTASNQRVVEEIAISDPVDRNTFTQADDELECSINQDFPQSIRRYCWWITHYAGVTGLDPDLVASVILQESSGNPEAISSSGAVGLMQVMPRDGLAASYYCINGPCFVSRPTIGELLDPEYNIEFGTALLADLIKMQGSSREGLMAYGPENIGYLYADKVLGIYQQYQ